MKNLTNPTSCTYEAPVLKLPPSLTLRFKTTFSIQSLCAPLLLYSALAVIGSLFLITNCSLGYKYIKVLCLFSDLH